MTQIVAKRISEMFVITLGDGIDILKISNLITNKQKKTVVEYSKVVLRLVGGTPN